MAGLVASTITSRLPTKMQVQGVVLNSRPGINGKPVHGNFLLKDITLWPALRDGDVLVRTMYLSVDTYMRCRMNEDTGSEYLTPWQLSESVDGGGLGMVEISRCSYYSVGDVVSSFNWPWQTHAVMKGSALQRVDLRLVYGHLSYFLGAVGITGLTSLMGVRLTGSLTKGTNQTMVVYGEASACASLAGPIGRLDGCARVVGICGSDEKSEKIHALEEFLGFSAAINYRDEDVSAWLKNSCPDGVDVYFYNVGGAVSDAVIQQMNIGGHVIVCGKISQYNNDVLFPPPLSEKTQKILRSKDITWKRYMVLSYMSKEEADLCELSDWVKAAKFKLLQTEVTSIENMGVAFCSMMKGRNIGKQVVKLSE